MLSNSGLFSYKSGGKKPENEEQTSTDAYALNEQELQEAYPQFHFLTPRQTLKP